MGKTFAWRSAGNSSKCLAKNRKTLKESTEKFCGNFIDKYSYNFIVACLSFDMFFMWIPWVQILSILNSDLVKNLWKMRGNVMVNSCQLWHLLFYFSVESFFPLRWLSKLWFITNMNHHRFIVHQVDMIIIFLRF